MARHENLRYKDMPGTSEVPGKFAVIDRDANPVITEHLARYRTPVREHNEFCI